MQGFFLNFMKILVSFFILLIVVPIFADDFQQADAIMKEAVRLRTLTAKTEMQTIKEVENLDRLCTSARLYLSTLNSKIDELKKSNKEVSKANEELSVSIKSDVQNIDLISKYLDKFYKVVYLQLPKDCTLRKQFKIENFSAKTVPEKLRTTLAFLEAIKRADKEVLYENNMVSTGIFLRINAQKKNSIDVVQGDVLRADMKKIYEERIEK